jgi:hypothetical protein
VKDSPQQIGLVDPHFRQQVSQPPEFFEGEALFSLEKVNVSLVLHESSFDRLEHFQQLCIAAPLVLLYGAKLPLAGGDPLFQFCNVVYRDHNYILPPALPGENLFSTIRKIHTCHQKTPGVTIKTVARWLNLHLPE